MAEENLPGPGLAISDKGGLCRVFRPAAPIFVVQGTVVGTARQNISMVGCCRLPFGTASRPPQQRQRRLVLRDRRLGRRQPFDHDVRQRLRRASTDAGSGAHLSSDHGDLAMGVDICCAFGFLNGKIDEARVFATARSAG